MEGKFKQMKLDEGMIVKTRHCNELYRISLRLNNTVLIPICYCIELHMDPELNPGNTNLNIFQKLQYMANPEKFNNKFKAFQHSLHYIDS